MTVSSPPLVSSLRSFSAFALLVGVALFGGSARADAPKTNFADWSPLPSVPARDLLPTVPKLEPARRAWFVGRGIRLTQVEVVLEGGTFKGLSQPPATSMRAGEIVTPELARQALEEVLNTLRFAQGDVAVVPDGSGGRIVVRVWPRRLIDSLKIEMHGAAVERSEMLRDAELAEDGEVIAGTLPEKKKRIEELFARRGYPSASVSLTLRETDDPARVAVLLEVRPGPQRIIQQRFFYTVGGDEARARPLESSYTAAVGTRADEDTLTTADGDLETRLRAQGFHRALVKHDLGISSRKITLRVRVEPGPFHLPRFEGNNSYDDAALTDALGMEKDSDRSGPHLEEKIRDFYVKRGFLDAEVKLEARPQPDGKTLYLVFTIVERGRVAVASRIYPCLKVTEIAKLKEGGPPAPAEIGSEIDSFLEEELPAADLLRAPDARARGVASRSDLGAHSKAPALDPVRTFSPDTYSRAIQHVQELYRSEGYLSATVGPLQVVRARCDPAKLGCTPLPLVPLPANQCGYDARGIPATVPPMDPALTCRPDPDRGVTCAPRVDLLIPVKLGPRTRLYDAAFVGVRSIRETRLAEAANLIYGDPIDRVKLDQAVRDIVDVYKDEGFVYVEARYTLEPSIDNTRARVRFDVTEGQQVFVKRIEIRGNELTRESVIRRRIALKQDEPYRASDVRQTEEWLATLGVFSGINVALDQPFVPQRNKVVIITLTEQVRTTLEPQIGFSTGEGVKPVLEYNVRNLLGYAVNLTLRGQASYLPESLILDPGVRENYKALTDAERIAFRGTGTLAFPEIGLGPRVRGQVDMIYSRDLLRDFRLARGGVVGSLSYRLSSQVQIQGGQSVEVSSVTTFRGGSLQQTLQGLTDNEKAAAGRAFRVPEGDSITIAQRIALVWDRRDNPFNAHRGTSLYFGVEVVNGYPTDTGTPENPRYEGHYLRFSPSFSGYIPIAKRVTLAMQMRVGYNLHWQAASRAYPDRLFYLGGFDSLRGWQQDSFIPYEDYKVVQESDDPNKVLSAIILRGGELMLNPRVELRFPLSASVDSVVFGDFGNLWKQASNLYDLPFELRAAVGTGVRVMTPVGPLVVDYGINATRRPGEAVGALNFSIGMF